jgi:hypothetical protein
VSTAVATTKPITLYEIVEELQFFLDTEEAGVPADLAEQFQAELLEKNVQAAAKVDDWIRAFRVIEHQIAFLKEEKARLGEQQTRLENGQKRMRRYLAPIVDMLPAPPMKGKQQPAKKLTGNIGTISLRKGSESLEVATASNLPTALCDVTVRMSATNWYLVRDTIQRLTKDDAPVDPVVLALNVALTCAPMEIIPDKAKVCEYLEQQIAQEVAGSFDIAVADDADRPALLAAIAEAVYTRCGARIRQGEPTVVVK